MTAVWPRCWQWLAAFLTVVLDDGADVSEVPADGHAERPSTVWSRVYHGAMADDQRTGFRSPRRVRIPATVAGYGLFVALLLLLGAPVGVTLVFAWLVIWFVLVVIEHLWAKSHPEPNA